LFLSPVILPPAYANFSAAAASAFLETSFQQVFELLEADNGGTCPACVAALNIFKELALTVPEYLPAALVQFCVTAKLGSQLTCEQDFGATDEGQVFVQVFANADISGLDGRYICNAINGLCSTPPAYPRTIAQFPKPKPANATAPKPSGERVKVAHLSDFHLDPRYAVGAEANCTTGLCCRTNQKNGNIANGTISEPAPLYGSFLCDTPYWLGVGALESMPTLMGINEPKGKTAANSSMALGWSIYTGVSLRPDIDVANTYQFKGPRQPRSE